MVEYGDYQVELQDGTQSAGEILGGREDANGAYDSPVEVRRMIYNLVGADAGGREVYSDRGDSPVTARTSAGVRANSGSF